MTAGYDFALTFDDGPGPSTAALLDSLDQHQTKATFFTLGTNIEAPRWCPGRDAASSLLVRALHTGHVLGNHTYSHPSAQQAAANPEGFRRDVSRGAALLRALKQRAGLQSGEALPFRLPFGPQPIEIVQGTRRGCADPRLQLIREMGLSHVHWTGIFDDWKPPLGGARALAARLMDHVRACIEARSIAVLALHDGAPPDEGSREGFARDWTVAAVGMFLEVARKNGWRPFPP